MNVLKWIRRVCWGTAVGVALAQNQSNLTAPLSVPFTTQIKKAVVFINTDCRNPKGVQSYVGTGFLLVIPEPRLGPDQGLSYLITNRHVVQPGVENSTPCDVVGYSVRMNVRANGSQQQTSQLLPINTSKSKWMFPADDSVDLAARIFSPNRDEFDFQVVPFAMLSDQKSDGLVEGDLVLFTGLFIQYVGRTRMQPIVRLGSLAMIPDETVPTTLKKLGRVYFAEVHAFGGNSGSPMFVDTGGSRRGHSGSDFKLLGVVSGKVTETADFHLQVDTSYNGEVLANSGIATIVPADELKAFLESSEVRKQRDELVAAIQQNKP